MKKQKVAISDTDILINLAKIDRLDILELLFEEVVIPHYVYDKELSKKAGRFLGKINSKIMEKDSIFKVVDRKKNFVINKLAEPIITDKYNYIGKGESECAGYASAIGTNIIVSDNTSDFKWLDEYITLTHNNILSICVYSNLLTYEEAEEIFTSINNTLSRPTRFDFSTVYSKSISRIKRKKWDEYLGIK